MNSKKENIDKKIERIHWNLKYKRKFLRILWLIPGYVFALLLMVFSEMQDAYIYYFLISVLLRLCYYLIHSSNGYVDQMKRLQHAKMASV